MNRENKYPVPPSHRTFQFGPITIDSNFDSGNCSNAEKVSGTTFDIWIGSDHPQNNYRTWFHFSVDGVKKGSSLIFNIKNMQNQSRLLNEGLVPVFRYEGSQQWQRIHQKVNTANICYEDGWIEWTFKHFMTENSKVFFAFFYPWSNDDNDKLISSIAQKFSSRPQVYFNRSTITSSWEGRPIQFLTISSCKGITSKQEPIQDQNLFVNSKKPKHFPEKKGLVISARVHPGQVPGSHVMTGILKTLVEDDVIAERLLDKFVFYIFPILNPDGVARGHYRVDSNGVNLNRYYINPSPKKHSSIYAVKKIIMHLHSQNRFFAFLDLHAHAARKGTFIYGNYLNQLNMQIDTCLFPKILSMNSQDFEYQGSNFTEKNMYCKDRADKVSKQGSGRVAIYKATKNPYSWTLQCNYNCSKVHNILEPRRNQSQQTPKVTQDNLNTKLIIEYKSPTQKEAKGFFSIQTYQKLGRQICQSFLDLIEANPISRIDNEKNYYKTVQNLKMNLAVALLRMATNRFQSNFKKIFYGLGTQAQERFIKALYFLVVKRARIQNLNSYVKDKNDSMVILPEKQKRKSIPRKAQSIKSKDGRQIINQRSIRVSRFIGSQQSYSNRLIRAQKQDVNQPKYQSDKEIPNEENKQLRKSEENIQENGQDQALSIESGIQQDKEQDALQDLIIKGRKAQPEGYKGPKTLLKSSVENNNDYSRILRNRGRGLLSNEITAKIKLQKIESQLQQQRNSLVLDKRTSNVSRVVLQIDDFRLLGIDSMRNSLNQKYFNKNKVRINNIRFKVQQLPIVISNFNPKGINQTGNSKPRPSVNVATVSQEPRQKPKLLRKGLSAKEHLSEAQ